MVVLEGLMILFVSLLSLVWELQSYLKISGHYTPFARNCLLLVRINRHIYIFFSLDWILQSVGYVRRVLIRLIKRNQSPLAALLIHTWARSEIITAVQMKIPVVWDRYIGIRIMKDVAAVFISVLQESSFSWTAPEDRNIKLPRNVGAYMYIYIYICTNQCIYIILGKVIPLQARCGPEGG